jgi:hypothetical protein
MWFTNGIVALRSLLYEELYFAQLATSGNVPDNASAPRDATTFTRTPVAVRDAKPHTPTARDLRLTAEIMQRNRDNLGTRNQILERDALPATTRSKISPTSAASIAGARS